MQEDKIMSIVWDPVKREHRISKMFQSYILKCANIELSPLSGTQLENAFNSLANMVFSTIGFHLYIHIFSKIPLNYALWLGPVGVEPEPNWWELGRG